MKFEKDYEKKYSKSISIYSRNNLIYSDELYEFRIARGTPNGKIIIPGKMIHLPYYIKRVSVEDKSVNIKDSKIISIDEIKKDNSKFIEAKIIHTVSFNLRLYDEYDNIFKIICNLEKYPTPNKKPLVKEFIAAYSIVMTKVLISNDNDIIYKNSYDKTIYLRNKAEIKEVQFDFSKQQKDISCYKFNCEEYTNLLVGIAIDSQMEVFCSSCVVI